VLGVRDPTGRTKHLAERRNSTPHFMIVRIKLSLIARRTMVCFLGSDESAGCTGAQFHGDAGLTQN